ncbi:PREDICTED: snaclec 5-like [Branchiostoma belcheri]|uniref:Snaclec 5-like n=1 Tax=Branchiostoma belcheri TaxID=7741 RepID=A0A6P4YM48_BRABE|nr:PREDICTED: snaclec 5-like [Branchiostoma belcheri]
MGGGKRLAAAAVAVCVVYLVRGTSGCPSEYASFNGLCYKSFTQVKNRAQASDACVADGGMLAMPKDSATNEFLATLAPVVSGRWLGLVDRDIDGQWEFEDGDYLTGFSSWRTSEPDSGDECASFYSSCPADYASFNGVCYKSFTGSNNRAQARDACVADGAMLAMPKDSATNEFLATLAPVTGGRWLGLTDRDLDGQWEFEDGDYLTGYSSWLPNEPEFTIESTPKAPNGSVSETKLPD